MVCAWCLCDVGALLAVLRDGTSWAQARLPFRVVDAGGEEGALSASCCSTGPAEQGCQVRVAQRTLMVPMPVLGVMGEFCLCVRGLCRIEVDGERREVWKYIIENVSIPVQPEEEERERQLFRDVRTVHH